jgi:hypothetical protein
MTLAPGNRKQQLEYMLSACEDEARGLTDWERNFIESLREQFTNRGDLSERQTEILERIYCEKV